MSSKNEPYSKSWWQKLKSWVLPSVNFRSQDGHKHSVIEQSVTDMLNETDIIANAHEEEKNILKNLIDFGSLEASDVMVTRAEIIAAPINTTIAKLKQIFIKEGISRLPIYNQTLEHIEGFVHVKDMLKTMQSGASNRLIPQAFIRAVTFVPQSIKVVDLLSKMRANKSHLAIVLDEHAGTAGLVTIEDIVEELVGDIQDEYDQGELQDLMVRTGNSWTVDATTDIEEVEAALETHFPNEKEQHYSTIGGFVITHLGFIPQIGYECELPGTVRMKVLDATNRRVKKLQLTPVSEE
jgi:magnesium and cobalt transporter